MPILVTDLNAQKSTTMQPIMERPRCNQICSLFIAVGMSPIDMVSLLALDDFFTLTDRSELDLKPNLLTCYSNGHHGSHYLALTHHNT